MPPEPIYKEIGDAIRTERQKSNLTQEKLAQRLGMSRASLANIETGRQTVLVHQLYRFAEVLHMSPIDLLPSHSLSLISETHFELPSDVEFPDDLNSDQKLQVARLLELASA